MVVVLLLYPTVSYFISFLFSGVSAIVRPNSSFFDDERGNVCFEEIYYFLKINLCFNNSLAFNL